MNNSFARLIDGMNATLRTEVLSRIDDDFARGQVFGVINLLNTFKVRADWSCGFLSQQIDALFDGIEGFVSMVRQGAHSSDLPGLPDLPARPLPTCRVDELLAQREAADRAICQLLDWLDQARGRAGAEQVQALEALLRNAMRAEIAIELKQSPRPLFAEMSSGRERPPASA